MAESIGRLVLAGRDLSKLAAYTQRVTQLMKSIDNNRKELTIKTPGAQFKKLGIVQLCDMAKPRIVFENVPIITPSGDVLVSSLSLTINCGQHVLVTGKTRIDSVKFARTKLFLFSVQSILIGPNGCGKSSLFRIIGELWPLCGGKMIKPPNNKLFYIPQKPYLALGSLRDQLIYPDTQSDMIRKGVSDDNLMDILSRVELSYLLERDYNMDSTLDWQEVFSGGEKQRIAIARLIYHKPLFAILDECTSAVSIDVESNLYRYLTCEIGCTVLSVTHRVKQLSHFHKFALR